MTGTMQNRREFGQLFTGGLVASTGFAAKINSRTNGVWIGAQSYSFRDRDFDKCLDGMKEVGLGEMEMWQGHAEPQGMQADALKKWREETPLSHFEALRKKADAAGVTIYAYNYSFRDNFTDREIERGFEFAKALGCKIITASATVTVAKRIDPFAKKAKIKVGMHNHSRIHENEFARPEDFAAAMAGMSEYICVNLDIGHFTAANFDAVDYLSKHHERIVTLHIKDRKKDQGANVEFGQGDTPIKPVLQLLKEKKYKIPANIEYEYKGADTVAEMKKCFAYCKQAAS